MLPNHSPLVIAEQFGTLETLYPGRIDLGLGRAPGTDHRTLLALRRSPRASDLFPQDILELEELLGPSLPGQVVRAVPGAGTQVPLWILGSSLFGAQLAAQLGLPYAFAAHFAPKDLMAALALYRKQFKASGKLNRSQAMVCVNVIAAETDEEAKRLFTSTQQSVTNIFRAKRGQLPPPIDDIESYWIPEEKAQAEAWLGCSFVGSAKTVEKGLKAFIQETGVDEVMAHSAIYDFPARLRSYELLSQVMGRL
jgi:luciferase family oxidoreductase group 1